MTAHPLMGEVGSRLCQFMGTLSLCWTSGCLFGSSRGQEAKRPVSAYAPPPLSPAMTMMGWISAFFCLHCFPLSVSFSLSPLPISGDFAERDLASCGPCLLCQ